MILLPARPSRLERNVDAPVPRKRKVLRPSGGFFWGLPGIIKTSKNSPAALKFFLLIEFSFNQRLWRCLRKQLTASPAFRRRPHKVFYYLPSPHPDHALERWQRAGPALTPDDEGVIANAMAKGGPREIKAYFVGLLHVALTPFAKIVHDAR